MTVKPVTKDGQNRIAGAEILRRSEDCSSLPEMSIEPRKECVEGESDRESGWGSSEELSPKSVGKWCSNKNNKVEEKVIHSQVLRIREEDSHLGEDIREGINASAKDNLKVMDSGLGPRFRLRRITPPVDVVLFSRPILPSSPLSGRTTLKASP